MVLLVPQGLLDPAGRRANLGGAGPTGSLVLLGSTAQRANQGHQGRQVLLESKVDWDLLGLRVLQATTALLEPTAPTVRLDVGALRVRLGILALMECLDQRDPQGNQARLVSRALLGQREPLERTWKNSSWRSERRTAA